MGGFARGLRRLGMLVFGSLLGTSLLTCSESPQCGTSSVRFVLPEPQDELALHVRLCIEPGDFVGWTIWAGFDSDRMPSTTLLLEIDDSVDGSMESSSEGFGDVTLWGAFHERHCDEGLDVVVRREDDGEAGPLAGWMYASFEDDEAPVCTARWERSEP